MAAIHVEVVYASASEADAVGLQLPAGATVAEAIRASGIGERHPVDRNAVGIFGRRVAPDAQLADGDRVELYRPLVADPKEQRRSRVRSKAAKRP